MFSLIAQRFYRISGKIFLRLGHFRQRAWEEDLRIHLGSIDPTTRLEYPLQIPNPQQVHFGRGARISWFGSFVAEEPVSATGVMPRIFIGDGTYIGNRIEIFASKRVFVGKDVLIADDVCLNDSFPDPFAENEKTDGEIEIGDGAWIGENVCIFGDVTIGEHAVIGANAIVRQDIPPFSVAVGSPARIIKRHNFATGKWEATDADGEYLEDGLKSDKKRSVPIGGASP